MPQQYVAVGSSGIIETSTDGNNWAVRSTPRNTSYTGVATNGSTYIAIGSGDAIESTDGVTWRDSELVPRFSVRGGWGTTRSYAINASGNLVLLNTSASGSASETMFTTDGITWKTVYMPSKGVIWTAVASKGDQFVAISASNTIAVSTDGITWVNRTITAVSGTPSDIKANSSIYVALYTGTASYATSTDAVTWTARSMPTSSTWTSLWYNGSIFVATSSGSTVGAVSTDGISWTQTLDGT